MNDLRCCEVRPTGRDGLSAEAVAHCPLLTQYRQLSYVELAFHIGGVRVVYHLFPAAARLVAKQTVLHKTISAIRAETLEAINRTLISYARQEKFEDGTVARINSTVTAALMHAPSDSSLLWDAVRVMVRLLKQTGKLPGAAQIVWRNHRTWPRSALRRSSTAAVRNRATLYRDLIAATRATVAALQQALQHLVHCMTIEAIALRRGRELYAAGCTPDRPKPSAAFCR
nr:ISNCY family transposase [Bradyrhizobium sp. Ec3.3]